MEAQSWEEKKFHIFIHSLRSVGTEVFVACRREFIEF